MRPARRYRVVIAALLAVQAIVAIGAQEVRVVRSTGTAEILIPDAGWRQAVSGRRFPEGGTLATWTDGNVAFAGLGAEGEIGPLSVVELREATGRLDLRLVAGSIAIRADDVDVILETRFGVVRLVRATVRYGDGFVTVESGTVAIGSAAGGDERLVTAPDTAWMGRIPVEPIVQRP